MSRLVGILRFTPDQGVSDGQAAKLAEELGLAIERETEKIVKSACVAVIVARSEEQARAEEAKMKPATGVSISGHPPPPDTIPPTPAAPRAPRRR